VGTNPIVFCAALFFFMKADYAFYSFENYHLNGYKISAKPFYHRGKEDDMSFTWHLVNLSYKTQQKKHFLMLYLYISGPFYPG
jgi:hypothetical protein